MRITALKMLCIVENLKGTMRLKSRCSGDFHTQSEAEQLSLSGNNVSLCTLETQIDMMCNIRLIIN